MSNKSSNGENNMLGSDRFTNGSACVAMLGALFTTKSGSDEIEDIVLSWTLESNI